MQAAILAAGKSTRTYPLTIARPKPLLKAANRTLLEHNLDNLDGVADEIILVVGYRKEMVKKFLKGKYKNLKIRYVEQKQQSGTGNALLAVEKHVKNDFISLHGDDIYSKEDFKNVIKNKYSILVKRVENPGAFGIVAEKNNILVDLIEKPQKFISNLANTGLYKLDKKIFAILKNLKKSKRGEYELTDAIRDLAKKNKVYCATSKQWLPIGYPSDLLKADIALRKNKSIIGKNSKIHGNVKNSSIGNNCLIKGKVKNSIIMDNTMIGANSLIEDSIIASHVYFKGNALNAVIADNVKAKNVIAKNCKIWPNKTISGKTIMHDLK